MKLPKSCIEPPGPFAPKKVLQDFHSRAREWEKEDPDDLSVTYAIQQVEKALQSQGRRQGRKTTPTE